MNIFTREKHKNHNRGIYWTLTQRHFKVFFKSKISVVFSILVPLITLIIYVIFLRSLQTNAIDSALTQLLPEVKSAMSRQKAFLMADAWMLSGIVSVSCISVSLNTCNIAIIDKTAGVNKDFISSPISRRSVYVSYLLFNIIATFMINFVVLVIALIYLAVVGGFIISVGRIMLMVPILLLSTISASLITCFIANFIQNYNTFNSIMVIISSGAGFLIGSYMPVSMFPNKAYGYVTLFFPGTYCCGIFRNLFLTDYFNNYKVYLQNVEHVTPEKIAEVESKLSDTFSLNLDFFGTKLSIGYMILAILVFALLFIILNYLFIDYNFLKDTKRISRKK